MIKRKNKILRPLIFTLLTIVYIFVIGTAQVAAANGANIEIAQEQSESSSKIDTPSMHDLVGIQSNSLPQIHVVKTQVANPIQSTIAAEYNRAITNTTFRNIKQTNPVADSKQPSLYYIFTLHRIRI